jgi:hypothetical protein
MEREEKTENRSPLKRQSPRLSKPEPTGRRAWHGNHLEMTAVLAMLPSHYVPLDPTTETRDSEKWQSEPSKKQPTSQ